jgi:NTP pyrophosphatase (non-canonical NTP hydrolase)
MKEKEFQLISRDTFSELLKAYAKHGENNENRKNLFVSNTILVEEVGEVAKAIIDEHFNGSGTLEDIKIELLQTAAMAIEMIHEVNERINSKHGYVYRNGA